MAWSIKNYNAFLRGIRRSKDLDLFQARIVYGLMRAHLNRPLRGVDVTKHPRLSSRFAERALEEEDEPIRSLKEYMDFRDREIHKGHSYDVESTADYEEEEAR